MTTFSELDAYVKSIIEKYPDYKTNPIAAGEIRNHPDFSHVTIKQSWEDNYVYFYLDKSPTRVSCAFVFDKPMLQYLETSLTVAINNKW